MMPGPSTITHKKMCRRGFSPLSRRPETWSGETEKTAPNGENGYVMVHREAQTSDGVGSPWRWASME